MSVCSKAGGGRAGAGEPGVPRATQPHGLHLAPRLAMAQVTVFVYELVEGEVKVDKIEFTKPAPPGKEL